MLSGWFVCAHNMFVYSDLFYGVLTGWFAGAHKMVVYDGLYV